METYPKFGVPFDWLQQQRTNESVQREPSKYQYSPIDTVFVVKGYDNVGPNYRPQGGRCPGKTGRYSSFFSEVSV